jgi:putative aldouronate transport system permease protein
LKKQKAFHRTSGDLIFDIIVTIILVILIVIFVAPFIHLISYSFSDANRVKSGFLLWPVGFSLDSYKICFTNPNILNGMLISVLRTVIGAFSILLVNLLAAFVISKDEVLGVKFLRRFFIFTMYVSGGLIPTYLILKTLGLIGTFWVYIFPFLLTPFYLMLLKTYMESLPKSVEESALIDGASYFTVFYKITLPLCTPVVATVGLFAMLNHWNSMTDTALYNSMHPELYTLQYILYQSLSQASVGLQKAMDILGSRDISSTSLRMAMTVIIVVPIAAVYPIIQRYFVAGIMVGSIKA